MVHNDQRMLGTFTGYIIQTVLGCTITSFSDDTHPGVDPYYRSQDKGSVGVRRHGPRP